MERLNITGGAGGDILTSRFGNVRDGLNDTLNGGGGNDTLVVGGGSDSVTGGAGDDLLVIRYGNAAVGTNFNMAASNATITDFSVTNVHFTGIDRFDVTLGAGNDNVILGDASDTLRGGDGNDMLNTAKGAAVVNGGLGNDTWVADFSGDATAKQINLNLAGVHAAGNGSTYTGIEALIITGGAGNDVFTTKFGNFDLRFNDTLFGGGGNDRFVVGGGLDSVDGGAGNDVLVADYSTYFGHNFNSSSATSITDFSVATVVYTGVERLDVRLSSGTDNITLGTGNDSFSGGGGADTVLGGLGADRLTGGDGGDHFVYKAVAESTVAAAGRDTIADFDPASDVIDLSAIDAIAGGTENAFDLIDAAVFSALGQVRVFFSGANTVVQVNSAGSLAADMQITLLGHHVIGDNNFVL